MFRALGRGFASKVSRGGLFLKDNGSSAYLIKSPTPLLGKPPGSAPTVAENVGKMVEEFRKLNKNIEAAVKFIKVEPPQVYEKKPQHVLDQQMEIWERRLRGGEYFYSLSQKIWGWALAISEFAATIVLIVLAWWEMTVEKETNEGDPEVDEKNEAGSGSAAGGEAGSGSGSAAGGEAGSGSGSAAGGEAGSGSGSAAGGEAAEADANVG